jgi:cold shock CspA family protein
MPHGAIKYFDPYKGIGFIQRADTRSGKPEAFSVVVL